MVTLFGSTIIYSLQGILLICKAEAALGGIFFFSSNFYCFIFLETIPEVSLSDFAATSLFRLLLKWPEKKKQVKALYATNMHGH